MENRQAGIEQEISDDGQRQYYHALVDLFDRGFGEMFGHEHVAQLSQSQHPEMITILAAGEGHFDALALVTLFPKAKIFVTELHPEQVTASQEYWTELVQNSQLDPQLHTVLQNACVTFAQKDATIPEDFPDKADVVIVRNPDTSNSPATRIIDTACAITEPGGYVFATTLGFQERFMIMARLREKANHVTPRIERDNQPIPYHNNPNNNGDTAVLIAQKQ